MEKSYSFKAPPKETTELKYLLLKPDDIKEGEKLPLIIFLHGAGERGDDLNLLKVHGIPKYFGNEDFPVRCICLAPQCPSENFWTILTHELKELIEFIIRTEPVDENKYVINYIYSIGQNISETDVNSTLDVRPVVFLKSRILFLDGNGSLENPYVVK